MSGRKLRGRHVGCKNAGGACCRHAEHEASHLKVATTAAGEMGTGPLCDVGGPGHVPSASRGRRTCWGATGKTTTATPANQICFNISARLPPRPSPSPPPSYPRRGSTCIMLCHCDNDNLSFFTSRGLLDVFALSASVWLLQVVQTLRRRSEPAAHSVHVRKI